LPFNISIDFNMDEWTKVRDLAYIDGSVRVLHLSEGYLELTSYIKFEGQGHSLISYLVTHRTGPR